MGKRQEGQEAAHGGRLAAAALAAEEAAKAKAAEEAEAIPHKERVSGSRSRSRPRRRTSRGARRIDAAEINWKKKLEGLDAEVTLRARSGTAAEAEAATARLAVMREMAMKRLVFAEAEQGVARSKLVQGKKPWKLEERGRRRTFRYDAYAQATRGTSWRRGARRSLHN